MFYQVLTKNEEVKQTEDTSIILGEEANSCKSLENITKTHSIWMSSSTDWSTLQLHLGKFYLHHVKSGHVTHFVSGESFSSGRSFWVFRKDNLFWIFFKESYSWIFEENIFMYFRSKKFVYFRSKTFCVFWKENLLMHFWREFLSCNFEE